MWLWLVTVSARKYRSFWVLVWDLNQNIGLDRTLPHNEINLLSLITGVVFPLPSVAASAATTATLAQQPQQPQTPASNNSEQQHLQSSNKKLSHSLDHLNSSSSQVAMWRSEMEVKNEKIQLKKASAFAQ